MRLALARHDIALGEAIESNGGWLFKHTGDGVVAAFATARSAIDAAIAAQRRLELPVRMGICTGEAESRGDDYFGPALNRAARTMAAGHGGQVVVAASTAAIIDGANFIDLGEHRLRDLSQPQRLYQVVAEGLKQDFPPLRTLDHTPGNLPAQTTSFLGREKHLAEIAQLLTDARLVTLVGVGGVGKTRLAVQLAAEVSTRYAEGTWLVELASLRDSTAIGHAVAGVLGVREQPGKSIEQGVVQWLGKRRLLLVLDNCEHLIDAVADLTNEILARCPNVSVLATSREALMLDGERVWPVPSLGFREGAASPAVALFVERARAVVPSFELGKDEEHVAEICRRLDGVPLAIELAAARTRSMSPAQIRARLEERFKLLTGGSRRALERHQSLRQAVQWSFDLLTPQEQAALSRASVFAGEFSLEAAEKVCAGAGVDEFNVVDLLDSLVRKSLMSATRSEDVVRYGLLETIRQFGEEQLATRGEGETARAAHAAYFAKDSDAMFKIWRSPREAEAYVWLDREIANLRAAFRWASDCGQVDLAARIASNIGDMGRLSLRDEAANWASEIIDAARKISHPRLVVLLTWAASSAWAFLRLEEAKRYGEEALALCDDPRFDPFVWIYTDLAFIAAFQGDNTKALALLRAGAAHPADRHDRFCRAFLQYVLAPFGQAEEAMAMAAEAAAVTKAAGFPTSIGVALAGTGRAFATRDPIAALAAFEEGLEVARACGSRTVEALIFSEIAGFKARHGDPVNALKTFLQMLVVWRGATELIIVSTGLSNLIVLLDRLGYSIAAATLLGHLVKDIEFGAFAPELKAAGEHLRTVLDQPAYDTASQRGSAMLLEDAVAFAEVEVRQALAERSRG